MVLIIVNFRKKSSNRRKRIPNIRKGVLLELTMKRINTEITERCVQRAKRGRTVDEIYEWKQDVKSNGWCMTNSSQCDDDDKSDELLGINNFFRQLSACSSTQKDVRVVDEEEELVIAEEQEQDGGHELNINLSASSSCRDETSCLNNACEMQSLCC